MVPTITALPAGLRDLAAIDTELLVVPVFEDDDVLAILDEVTNAEAQRARARGEFTATRGRFATFATTPIRTTCGAASPTFPRRGGCSASKRPPI